MPRILRHCMVLQRFWFARGRWNTAIRIGKRLLSAGLNVNAPSDLLKALSSDHVAHEFSMWFRRLLPRNVEPPCMRSVLNAFGICAFKGGCADISYAGSGRLIELAETFARLLDERLHAPALFDPVLLAHMEDYLSEYCEWVYANEAAVRETMLQIAASRALFMVSKRTPRAADAAEEQCAKLSIFFGGACAVKHFLQSSREVQLILRLKDSPFWGCGDTSVFRLMHEALMDCSLSRDTVCVRFRANYRHIPPSKVGRFLQDLRAVLMYPLQDRLSIIHMARALDFDPSRFELTAFAHNLLPTIAQCTPNPALANQISDSWQRSDLLDALREAAVSMRYAFALEELERCRLHVMRHDDGLHHTQADALLGLHTVTALTEKWIERVLRRHSRSELERLAAGDSFALLRFHDHEIVRFVLESRFDAPLLVPEVLQFDVGRMRAIVCGGLPRERVFHMVDTNEVPEALPPYLKDSVASLRQMVYVCRFQHGDRIAELTQRAALRMLGN